MALDCSPDSRDRHNLFGSCSARRWTGKKVNTSRTRGSPRFATEVKVSLASRDARLRKEWGAWISAPDDLSAHTKWRVKRAWMLLHLWASGVAHPPRLGALQMPNSHRRLSARTLAKELKNCCSGGSIDGCVFSRLGAMICMQPAGSYGYTF